MTHELLQVNWDLFRERTFEFIWVTSPVYEELGSRDVIGYNVKASSFLRKKYAMMRAKMVISDLELDLIVVDDYEEINSFKVMEKLIKR